MFSDRIDSWKKIAAAAAVFGFIVSIIPGLIGGVTAGALFLRAVVSAVFAAGISLGIMKLIEIFIPELLAAEAPADEDAEAEELPAEDATENISGKNLDITVEDAEELSYAGEPAGLEELEASGEGGGSAAEPAAEAAPDASGAGQIEELEALPEEGAENGAAEPQAEMMPVAKASSGGADLPDIGEFSDSFEQPEAVQAEGMSDIDEVGGPGGAEIFGDMHNTQEIVKAVQTVLKKDQEG